VELFTLGKLLEDTGTLRREAQKKRPAVGEERLFTSNPERKGRGRKGTRERRRKKNSLLRKRRPPPERSLLKKTSKNRRRRELGKRGCWKG